MESSKNRPLTIKLMKYNLGIHLIVYLALIILAMFDGQPMQMYWGVHIVAVISLFFIHDKPEAKMFYYYLGYLLIIPTIFVFKFYTAALLVEFGIPLNYLILNVVSILSLYSALPFLIKGKFYYLGVKNT